VIARGVTLFRCSETLCLVHLRAQFQTLRHARFCAAFFETSNGGTVLSLISLVTLACAIEAQTVIVAVIQLHACLEAAVMSRPTRLTVA